ncbi:RNA polymerase primary sigma factor [Mumia flava]|uniref:RNA polymerase primary sigma factor n=1 Tax=Mumia flava TaxID=1348852 RepID=A0A0B2BAZ5_9ACTN|nr:sigma-70 family RNA polymerase sigma factor [Mumia flava]PJJ53844.1 RNA polymerase primary sigma factor [Mumia flava]
MPPVTAPAAPASDHAASDHAASDHAACDHAACDHAVSHHAAVPAEHAGRHTTRPDVGIPTREQLVLDHLRYVAALARPYDGLGVPHEDLVQEGVIGLLEAVDRFDPERGTRFTAYARPWVRSRIARAVSRRRMVRLPPRAERELVEVRAVAAELARAGLARSGEPDVGALAARVGTPPERIAWLLAVAGPTLSLDEQLVDHPAVPGPGDDDAILLVTVLEDAMAGLPSVQRDVLERRFGLDGLGSWSLSEIADQTGRDHGAVRRDERRGLVALRRHPALRAFSAAR